MGEHFATFEDTYSHIDEGNVVITDLGGETWDHQNITGLSKANGFIIVYDITDRETFQLINEDLVEKVRHGKPNAPIFLVGNKADEKPNAQVTSVQGQAKANKLNCQKFLETSAKDNINVKEVFHNLVDIIRQMNMEKKRKEINIEFRGIVAERRLNYEPRAPIAAQDRAEAHVAVQDEVPVAVQDEVPVAVQDKVPVAVQDKVPVAVQDEAHVAVQDEAHMAVQDEAHMAVQDEAHMAVQDSQSTRAEKEAKAQES